MGRMHTQRTEELMLEAEQPPELMAAKLASQVRLSPPISAQSRLQSRPNLASNLASQLHIDFGKALLALLRELARAHLISMPPGADARLERHRIEEALITGECF
jgi:hypothetical protein